MKTLPQYFAIQKCDNPLWQEYIDWLNEKYNITITGTITSIYYWFDGVVKHHYYPSNFKNTPTILTLEEWKEMITNPTPMNNEYIYDTAPSLALARKIITSFIVNVKEHPEYLSTKDDWWVSCDRNSKVAEAMFAIDALAESL